MPMKSRSFQDRPNWLLIDPMSSMSSSGICTRLSQSRFTSQFVKPSISFWKIARTSLPNYSSSKCQKLTRSTTIQRRREMALNHWSAWMNDFKLTWDLWKTRSKVACFSSMAQMSIAKLLRSITLTCLLSKRQFTSSGTRNMLRIRG